MKLIAALAFALLTATAAEAKVIELPYMKFQMPDPWSCQTKKSETTCTSIQGNETKQSVVLINAKETTPAETLDSFYQQLSKPKGVGSIKKIEYVQIGDIKWIQAHHSNSELNNYDTYYWITRVENIAILVTYTYLAKFESTLAPLAQSLPKSFQLNLTEINRLSAAAKEAERIANMRPGDTPPEYPPPQFHKQEEHKPSFSQQVSELLKSRYAIPVIMLCVIILIFALFLR